MMAIRVKKVTCSHCKGKGHHFEPYDEAAEKERQAEGMRKILTEQESRSFYGFIRRLRRPRRNGSGNTSD